MTEAGNSPLVVRLLAALGEAKVEYCFFKSTESIDLALAGTNDLDLLISRRHQPEFLAVVHSLGFKPARPSHPIPGVVDYYAIDFDLPRVIHIHAHYSLVLGDDLSKNYRLPIEEPYIASSRLLGPARVPEPEFEYLLLVLRMAVKHCPWDSVAFGKGRLTAGERRELADLETRVRPERLDQILRQVTPFLPSDLVGRVRPALEAKSGVWVRVKTGRVVQRVMADLGRRPPGRDVLYKMSRRVVGRIRPRSRTKRKSLDSGGAVVALIGGDGSGKSGTVDFLVSLLRRDFEVVGVHMGKPPRSFSTRVIRRMSVVSGRRPVTDHGLVEGFPGFWYCLGQLAIAHDRARHHTLIRRRAGSGTLVISDRYPLSELVSMDRPRLGALQDEDLPRYVDWMIRREAGCYERIARPDLSVVLKVSPSVAVERRPEQDREFVMRRAREVAEASWSRPDVVVVDADVDRRQVLDRVLRLVWEAL